MHHYVAVGCPKIDHTQKSFSQVVYPILWGQTRLAQSDYFKWSIKPIQKSNYEDQDDIYKYSHMARGVHKYYIFMTNMIC